jgi:hypothetical protein
MKYETPELTALTPAINAIQGTVGIKVQHTLSSDHNTPNNGKNESLGTYMDWED